MVRRVPEFEAKCLRQDRELLTLRVYHTRIDDVARDRVVAAVLAAGAYLASVTTAREDMGEYRTDIVIELPPARYHDAVVVVRALVVNAEDRGA